MGMSTSRYWIWSRTTRDPIFSQKIDEIAENAAIDVLKADGRKILLISEECGEKVIFGDLRSPDVRKRDIDFTVVLDPLDGTFNVVAGIPFYSVSIAIGGSDLSGSVGI
jgi:myo-inositol-1(or 4)-monophosphatase